MALLVCTTQPYDKGTLRYARGHSFAYRGDHQRDALVVVGDGRVVPQNAAKLEDAETPADSYAPQDPAPLQWQFDDVTKVAVVPIADTSAHIRNARSVTMPPSGRQQVPKGSWDTSYLRNLDISGTNEEVSDITQTVGTAEGGYDGGGYATRTSVRVCSRDASNVETEAVPTTATATREPTAVRAGGTAYAGSFASPALAAQARVAATPVPDDWGPWVVVSPATCLVAGLERRESLSDPSVSEERAVPALGHVWGAGVVVRTATCLVPGLKVRVCSNDPSHTVEEELPARGHDWGPWEDVVSATCDAAGLERRVCRRDASHVEGRGVVALGHDWGPWEDVVSATCDAAGLERRVCRRDASHAETRSLVALGHELEAVPAVPASCEAGGTVAHWRCVRCGRLFRDAGGVAEVDAASLALPALGHAWDAGVVTVEPTYDREGEVAFTCGRDPAHVRVEAVPALDLLVDAPELSARAHVQGAGWLPAVGDGAVCGTVGCALRLEALALSVAGSPVEGGVECRTHVQGVGWQAWARDGEVAGTVGRGLRVEAVECRLTGALARGYDLWYRTHVQGLGWMGWASSGMPAGTAGRGLRMEAVEFRLLPRGSRSPDGAAGRAAYAGALVAVRAHVQGLGWLAPAFDGMPAGYVGRGLRLEALRVSLPDQPFAGGVICRAHVQGTGWQDWAKAGADAGTVGEGRRVEAVELVLTGEMAERYDLWCRAHVQGLGWMDWVRGGTTCGTTGHARRLEAVRVVLLPKGSPAPEGL